MTEELTGKPYEAGDLSIELDKRVKSAVADYCGKEAYEFGDLSKEIDRRVKDRVADYIGKDEYEFGDVSRQIEKNRRAWVKDFLGEEASENYEFGDITKKAMANLTGSDDYQVRITNWFGDRSFERAREFMSTDANCLLIRFVYFCIFSSVMSPRN